MFRVAFKTTFDRQSREEKAFQAFRSLDRGHDMSAPMAETAWQIRTVVSRAFHKAGPGL